MTDLKKAVVYDLVAVQKVMGTMGKVEGLVTNSGTIYSQVIYGDDNWVCSKRGLNYILTKNGKYTTVTQGSAKEIIETLNKVKAGDKDIKQNEMAKELEQVVKSQKST